MVTVAVLTGIPLADVKAWSTDELVTATEVLSEHGGRNG